MNVPSNLKYTKSHEWVRAEADGTVTIGITDHAQELLGDLVFVELPEVGKTLSAEQEAAVVESVKAASDVYAPISGTVTEVNTAVSDAPESVNEDAYAAWLFKMKPANAADVDALLGAAEYTASAGE
ncbi:MAG: glycine cleavage system protein GcvH [Propionivibrio sp.]|jgi:glycine cleavage system H protein|uniref:glycine cleavage system protein GcvH n=1 Tax=Propionivibrio sp. TaxID=2212460 RepID=UPI001B63539A|nr:glycine cleavage system protein GcvH [Propionivibrio sp.]MBP7202460.1 glycine cleavage system protein GcvH [Propionivibrio sp.]